MLLIYTQKITPRITYSFKHVCTGILGIPIKFTAKIEEFIAHEGMKLSYGKQSLGNEIFIQNVELLLEQGLTDIEVKVQDWGGVACFFSVSENSSLPFDIFAASFYLLSRYEEYLPHVRDEESRFPASESLAHKEGFLENPVIDIWAFRFKKILQEKFPDIQLSERSFQAENIIAVTEAFCYRKKGIMRTVLGFIMDIIQFKIKYVIDRVQVMLRFTKDPYDNFSAIIKFLKKNKISLKFMFQVSDFSTYDRNINHSRPELQSLIKSMADYAEVGLQPGFYANQEIKVLKAEKKRLEAILNRPVESAINIRYNLLLPDAYKHLAELEIQRDFSMGYPESFGFRAGTCTPFLFYDLTFEITTPLEVHPFAISIQATKFMKETEIEGKVLHIKRQVASVDGNLTSIFSNEDFSAYTNAKRNFSILKLINEIK